MYPESKSVDPVDTCFSCDGTPHMACHECKVLHCALHASILCQSEICVGLRQFWTANLAAVVVASSIVAASTVDTRHGVPTVVAPLLLTPVLVCGSVASGMQCLLNIPKMRMVTLTLQIDQENCFKLQGELKTALFGMCTPNRTVATKPRHADTKADLIFKCVFCNYL